MNTPKIIRHYHNPSLFISSEEALLIIEELRAFIKERNSYLLRVNPGLPIKERYEQIVKQETEWEIEYYETAMMFNDRQTYYKEDFKGYSKPDSGDEEQPAPVTQPSAETGPLEKKINAIEEVVYQLIGGLFNQEKQSNVIDNHLAYLTGKEVPYSSTIGDESIFPTTRQGDANEEEIRLLKQQVSKLEETVNVLLNLLQNK